MFSIIKRRPGGAAVLFCGLLAGCSTGGRVHDGDGGSGGGHDLAMTDAGPTGEDAATPGSDLGAAPDLRGPGGDLAASVDLLAPPDLRPPPDLLVPPDLAYPAAQGVDIYVDNTCKMDVVPKVFNVPAGTTLKLTYYNRSRDYMVDVWMSYGGGFTDLGTGMSWAEPIEHCRLPRPYNEYADISTACSKYRLMINCL